MGAQVPAEHRRARRTGNAAASSRACPSTVPGVSSQGEHPGAPTKPTTTTWVSVPMPGRSPRAAASSRKARLTPRVGHHERDVEADRDAVDHRARSRPSRGRRSAASPRRPSRTMQPTTQERSATRTDRGPVASLGSADGDAPAAAPGRAPAWPARSPSRTGRWPASASTRSMTRWRSVLERATTRHHQVAGAGDGVRLEHLGDRGQVGADGVVAAALAPSWRISRVRNAVTG